MLRWLTTNLRLFFLAFILAVAVWVLAVNASDPDETSSLPQPVTLEYFGQDPGLIQTSGSPAGVEVSLRAPRSVWEQILADPASVRAIVDLTGLGPGDHELEITLQLTASPVRIISVTPSRFSLTLEPLSSLTLPVTLSILGQPAIGYQAGEAELNPAEVTLSGPESLVSRVASIRASLDLAEARQTIAASLPLAAFDSSGTLLTGVALSAGNVQVSIPILQLGGYRDLAVKVVTAGVPAGGYRLASVAALPPIVTVYSADSALIEALPGFVETASLNISGASEDIETRLDLVLPTGVTLVGDQTVLVQVGISAIEDSLTLGYRPVEVTGLAAGLRAQLSPITVDVILSGPIPALQSLNASDVKVTVDASGRGPGTYQLTPVVTIPVDDVLVQSILPGTVQVIISTAATPTP